MGQSWDAQKCVLNAYIIKSELFGTRPAEPWSWESRSTKSVNSLCFTRFPAHHYHHSATGLHRSDSEVADIYTGCRVSAAPLCSGLRVTSCATAKTQRKVMKMTPPMGTTAPPQTLTELWVTGHKSLIFTRVAACHVHHSAAVCQPGDDLTDQTNVNVTKTCYEPIVILLNML